MLRTQMGERDRRPREQAELGRRLAASEGYLVLASDGRHVGVVDHVRYEQHADHPDEIVVRRRNVLVRRRRAIPFDSIQAVDPTQRTVTLRIDSTAVDRFKPA
jgi:sporulation protein YlmC with PRC-barrel domain